VAAEHASVVADAVLVECGDGTEVRPRVVANRNAKIPSWMETPIRSLMISLTLRSLLNERPRSPRKVPAVSHVGKRRIDAVLLFRFALVASLSGLSLSRAALDRMHEEEVTVATAISSGMIERIRRMV
jgi:hypothetical protein